MGLKSYKLARKFDWDKISKKYFNLYQTIIDNKK